MSDDGKGCCGNLASIGHLGHKGRERTVIVDGCVQVALSGVQSVEGVGRGHWAGVRVVSGKRCPCLVGRPLLQVDPR